MASLCKEKGLEALVRALDPSRGASHTQILQLLGGGGGLCLPAPCRGSSLEQMVEPTQFRL